MPEPTLHSAVDRLDWADTALRNQALALAMDWGPEWLQPIQGRLAVACPQLDAGQRDALDALARQTMHAAHEALHALLRDPRGVFEIPSLEAFSASLGPRFAWLDATQRSRLHSQSIYYLRK
jgi:hypothetical protein